MISRNQDTALLIVGNSALENVYWVHYANYCLYREKGLRKEAFKHLENFLKSSRNWTTKHKIEFVKFLFRFLETVEDADYGPFPQPLSDQLAKPTLLEWCEIEKEDANPFRWFGKYYRSEEHLHKALEINPADNLARQEMLKVWTSRIYFAVHHLPEGYIGDPFEDIELSERIREQIQHLTKPSLKEYWTNVLEENLELVKNYIDWKISGQSDLIKWGQENSKKVGYGLIRTYYYEK